jgi:redox-sensitive bicupin YhaK (pirin superfamily)
MSWVPSADPVLGDKRSCDALELVVVPRVRDLGNGFAVRRAMPNEKRQMGWSFHLLRSNGTSAITCGTGHGRAPSSPNWPCDRHYLFDGRVMHRDGEGNAQEITPGAINLMTAGRGIAHSERSPQSARLGNDGLFGIQSWIALPQIL